MADAERLANLVVPEAVGRMLADAGAAGVSAEGLVAQLTKAVLEWALAAGLDGHLGYVKGYPTGTARGTPAAGTTGRPFSAH